MEPIFPGMDPYIEAPGVWPDFHDAFLAYAREALQPLLPGGYYAVLRAREEIGIAGYEPEAVMFPDVAVKRTERQPPRDAAREHRVASGTATLPERLVIATKEKPRVNFLEIRDASSGDRLVTLIELLSPSNKLSGPDREAFQRKQDEVLASEANWMEVDLLRGGKRIGCHRSVDVHCRKKGYDYSVVVSRASRRGPKLEIELYGFRVRDPLPIVSVPLFPPHTDVDLDMRRVFRRTYETGPYPWIARYDQPLDPSLAPDDERWVRELLEARGAVRRS